MDQSRRKTIQESEAAAWELELWTKDELYRLARRVGLKGRSSMTRQELIDGLRTLRHPRRGPGGPIYGAEGAKDLA